MFYDPMEARKLSNEQLMEINSNLVDAIMRSAPEPIKDTWKEIKRASSQEHFLEAENSLSALCEDWSRANTKNSTQHGACYCVLCGGFLRSPTALSNHFNGYGESCDVWRILTIIGREKYSKTEARAKERAEALQAEAIRLGTVYLTDLFKPASPKRNFSFDERTAEESSFADQRLKGLGFSQKKKKISQNVSEIRWERKTESAYILADPYQKGKIIFRAWPMSVKNNTKRARSNFQNFGEEIMDRWHNDLEGKLMVRVQRQLLLWDCG